MADQRILRRLKTTKPNLYDQYLTDQINAVSAAGGNPDGYDPSRWNSAASIVESTPWEGADNDMLLLAAASGNWESTYNTFTANSGSWIDSTQLSLASANAYNLSEIYTDTQITSLSSTTETLVDTLTSNLQTQISNNDTDISTLQGNITNIASASGSWDSTYQTVCSLSASWATGGGVGTDIEAASGNWNDAYTTVSTTSGAWNTYSSKNATIGCTFVGMGSALQAGLKAYLTIPYDCVIQKWYLIGNTVGNLVVDVWNDTWANFPPTVDDSIAGSEKPTLVSQQNNKDESLATWSTNISSGDVMIFKVDSCDTISQATLTIGVEKI